MRAVTFLIFLILAGCGSAPSPSSKQDELNETNPTILEEDRISILETRVSELETRLASEKVTREQIDKELANSIADVGEARLDQLSKPVLKDASTE